MVEVARQDKHILANLFQLYRYDSSDYNGEDLDASGQFAVSRYFDLYWTEAERHPFFIKLRGQLVGFVLAREFAPQKFSVAEFFVMRKYRRLGIGRCAAFLLFDTFAAEWHVAQEEANLPARLFWRKVVSQYTGGDFKEGVSERQPEGPKLSFLGHGRGAAKR